MTQAYIQATVRFIAVMGCAGVVLFAAAILSKEEPKTGLCNIRTLDCYNRLAR